MSLPSLTPVAQSRDADAEGAAAAHEPFDAQQYDSEFPPTPLDNNNNVPSYQGLPASASNGAVGGTTMTPVANARQLDFEEIDALAAQRAPTETAAPKEKGYSARIVELLAPRSRAKTELPTRTFNDDDKPSAYARVRNYSEQHPRRCFAIVCCTLCCILLIVLIALAVGLLLPITDSSLQEGGTVTELIDMCNEKAISFRVNTVLNNPGAIGGTMHDFDMAFDVDGRRLASARMPGFVFVAGDGQPISLEGTLEVRDEEALADTLNRFFRDDPIVVDVIADVTVSVLGLPVSTQLKQQIFLNTTEEEKQAKREAGGSAKLKSLKVTESSADILAALVQMLFNQTSKLVIVNMPQTQVDIYHIGQRVANASVAPNRLAFGLNPWEVTALINPVNVSASGALAGHFINDEAFDVTLRGAENADRSCFFQRLLTERIEIKIPFEEKKGGNSTSSLALDKLALQAVGARNIDLVFDVRTVLGFQIEGNVPQFTLEVLRNGTTPLGQIGVAAFPFLVDRASAPISVIVSDPRAAFDAAFALFRNEFVSLLVRGRSGAGATVFDRVLAALSFTLEANKMLTEPTMSDTEVSIKKLLLVDADASSLRARVDVSLPSLFSFAVVAKVNGIFVEIIHQNKPATRLRFDIDANLPDSFSTAIAAEVVDARTTADFASALLDGDVKALRLRGRPMFENVIGEMLQFLDTSFDIGMVSTSADTSFQFDALDVGTFESSSVAVSAKIRLSDALRIETEVPLPTATLAFLRARNELLRAAFQIEVLNNVVTVRLNVSVTDAPKCGTLLGDLINAGPTDRVEVTISGVSGMGNVIGTVLSFMQFNVTLADGMPPPSVGSAANMAQKAVTIQSVDLVGNLNYRAHFVVPMLLSSNVVNLAMPQVELAISIGGVPRVFLVGLEEFTLRRGALNTALKFYIAVPTQAAVNSGLNTLLGDAAPNIVLSGSAPVIGTPTDNLLQRVLAQFSTQFVLSDDKKPKTMTVDGGVVPVFQMAIKQSTRDTLLVDLSLKLTMPDFVTFPLTFGDLNADVLVQNSVIVNVKKNDLRLGQGENDLHLDVLLTAVNNRRALETAASAVALGTGFAASIVGQLGGPRLNVPVGLRYDFTLPADAAGEDSSFVECVDMAKMELSGLSTIIGGTCSVSLDLVAFMRNPLPFAIQLNALQYVAEFDDLDGALCFGGCIYPPKNNVLIGTVNVKPMVLLPSSTTKPVNQFLDGSSAGGQGSWNEVCARLGSAFILNNDLKIDIERGIANLFIEQFNIDISFALPKFFIDKNEKRDCSVRIAEKRAMKNRM
jgi:sporulation-control protein spo0M